MRYDIRMSEALQLAAVQEDGYAILDIIQSRISPSEAVQIAAVTQNGYVLRHLSKVKKVSEAVQIAAISEDPYVIRYLIDSDPSETVLTAIVNANSESMRYIILNNIPHSKAVKDAHYIRWEL